MSKKRFTSKKRLKRDAQGNVLCRYCETAVKPPRRTFCSSECVHEYKLRRSSSYVRRFILIRDKGICAICGVDTATLKKRSRAILKYKGREEYQKFALLHGMPPERKSWWDADHIIPVSMDGGECGLEGYRTLCVPCHKEITKELQKTLRINRAKEKLKEKITKEKNKVEKKTNGTRKKSTRKSSKIPRRVFED